MDVSFTVIKALNKLHGQRVRIKHRAVSGLTEQLVETETEGRLVVPSVHDHLSLRHIGQCVYIDTDADGRVVVHASRAISVEIVHSESGFGRRRADGSRINTVDYYKEVSALRAIVRAMAQTFEIHGIAPIDVDTRMPPRHQEALWRALHEFDAKSEVE